MKRQHPLKVIDAVCRYCKKLSGEAHAEDCVCRQRTVVVSLQLEYVVSVTEDWEESMIEFHRNDGSWCATNLINELDALQERTKKTSCFCSNAKYSFVREATEEDEERDQLFVEAK